MKFVHWGTTISAIATFSGLTLPVLAEPHVQQDATVQADSPDQTNNLPTEQIFTAQDAVLRVAPDPRATVTDQVAAETPVRVTHQSDRYFYIEVIEIENLEDNRDADPIQGWISDCQLYGECQ